MNFVSDIRDIVGDTITKIQAQEKKIQEHERERDQWSDTRFAEVQKNLQNELTLIRAAGLRVVRQRIEQYKAEVQAADVLDGSKLTEDAKLLAGGFQLTSEDLAAAFDRAAGNRTMEKLIYRYAQDHAIPLGRVYYTAAEKLAAADGMESYARNALDRPEYWDLMGGDDYLEQAVSPAIKND